VKGVWRGYSADRYSFKDHWIEVGKEQKLHAWWLEGDSPNAPVVLYLHGARWNLTGSVTRIDRWRQFGFAVLAVDYRGFGQSTDVTPTEAYAYEDAEAAWDYIAKIAPGRSRYIVGHSLGGAIATELARRRPDAAGLVLGHRVRRWGRLRGAAQGEEHGQEEYKQAMADAQMPDECRSLIASTLLPQTEKHIATLERLLA